MRIHQLIQALNEIKQKYPIYDFHNFELIVDDKEVAQLSLDIEKFAIKLTTQAESKEAEVVE